MRDCPGHTARSSRSNQIVDVAKILNGVLVLEPTKFAQHRIGVERRRQPPPRIAEPKRGPRGVRLDRSRFDIRDEGPEAS